MTWIPPTEFEEYRIVRPLGAGAMGVVFLAHDTLLDRPVAIKFINALEVDDGTRDRFFAEARAVARLSHPNVVAVHRVGQVRRRPYLVSEYVPGTSLAALPKPVPWQRALKIAIGLARGLGAAHRRGVLHRDIKPANAMLGEDGEGKLLDFGLAKLVSERAAPAPDHGRSDPVVASRRPQGSAIDATLSMNPPSDPPRRDDRRAPISTASDPGSALTADGAIIGTPLYLAPELWRSLPASQASDVYSLGVVLYELVTGAAPHAGVAPSLLAARVISEDAPAVTSLVAGMPTRLADLIDDCISRDPGRRPASGDALCERLQAVTARTLPPPDGCPYRGLSSFAPEHRAVFFGRAAETDAVVERLRTESFVIVAGDSGAGKSSLCRAAVLPAIVESSLAGTRWRAAAMMPGARPLARLEAALAEQSADTGLLLYVDSLEELLTMSEPAEAAASAERLAELIVATPRVRVLASARSDFLGRLAGLPGLGELIGRALFLLGPITDHGLRDAIIGPALASGYTFESTATVDALLASGRRHLPLLQFALAELWAAREQTRRIIPAEALARIGGVSAALARHADGVLAAMPAAERGAAREILLSLVTAEGTRARRSHAELIALAARTSQRAAAVLDALVRGRLLVARETESGEESAYAIAHEALLQDWDTLRRWLDHDTGGRAVRQRIEHAATEWDQLGRPKDMLWHDRRVMEAAEIAEDTLPARDAAFLRAARTLAARRRVRRWAAVLGIPVLVAAAALWNQINAARRRDATVDEARALHVHARTARAQLDHLRGEAFARFDDHAASEAEARWRDALAAAPAVERAYATPANLLEHLLQDAPDRADARDLLSTILFERAQLADQSGRGLERDELVRRMGVYGSADRWDTARLTVVTQPAGAQLTLRRYELSDGRWTESPETGLGTTPVVDRRTRSGSVVLTMALPGGRSVRLPVVLPPGEASRVAIRIPDPAEIPAGFVYVPAGSFLYGSAGSEDTRPFYLSQPAHKVATSSYLIATHETTFGEWMAFLRSLPRAQRELRAPRAAKGGYVVAVEELVDGRYRLTLGPAQRPYVATEGEAIHYRGRRARATQDWSRMPVTGISFEDGLAYTAWLDASGRVPGARPCTEYEWERAARGADARAFPHGERLDPNDANFDMTYDRVATAFGPDEVGSHPASDSPYGVHDLAGNVWEWTASVDVANTPAARGGGFFQFSAVARSENRSQDIADRRDAFYGFRVCATPRPDNAPR